MARTATGIDIGLRTAKVLRGRVKGNTFVVTDFVLEPNPSGTIAGGWEALGLDFKPTACRVGLTGREVNVRYTRVPRVPDWQLRKLMRFETEEIAGQSEARVASDFNVLPEIPEIEGEDVVLLAMARESLLDEHYDGLASYGGKLDAFTPNAIALYNAWLHYGVLMEDTVLVANIGHENLDVILARGSDLLFARNLTGGAKLFDDALVERFGVSAGKAEQIKRELATLDSARKFDDPNAEKASRALLGPAGQLQSLLQSSVMFCKSQVKLTNLKLDRVMLCGGGAALDGLAGYLKSAMNVSVELFDPFQVVDTSELDPEAADLLEDNRLEAVVALGLAHSASDPDAYAIEILPERVEKRRQFVEGTAFLIAAAVLAVLFMGLYAWKNHGVLDGLKSSVAALSSQLRRVTGTHHETEGLLEQNRALADHAAALHAIAGSGEQIARVLELLETSLPQDFWIEKLTSSWRFEDELGIPRGEERPILHLGGRALEGTEQPTVQFEELVDAIRTGLPARVVPRMASTGRSFSIDLCILVPPAAEAEPEEGD
ncbi:MAG: pilus assembly protein PilM [Planctomycetota bacterium]|nr:pilus assembly protein PilM [Planctomycetota bacterium]